MGDLERPPRPDTACLQCGGKRWRWVAAVVVSLGARDPLGVWICVRCEQRRALEHAAKKPLGT